MNDTLRKLHARRIVNLVLSDLADAYVDRVDVEENGETVVQEQLVVPMQEEFAARVQAWRNAGLDISYDNFDPVTGSVDVQCKPGPYELRINLQVALTNGAPTFEEAIHAPVE